MSQYGARGRALAGQDAATILTHYYAGTTIVPRDPLTPVRVLIASGLKPSPTAPIAVTGVGGTWSVDGLPGTFPAGATLTVGGSFGAWQVTVSGPDASSLAAAPLLNDVRIRPVDPTTLLQVSFKPSTRNLYRGVIRLIASTRVSAIDEVPLDQYLGGVVPVEMPSTWPAEALKAQAIAARSYAVRRLHPLTGTFDMYDDSRAQYYWGVRAERASVNAAIAATAGQVLMIGLLVANTVYCSADGGATENSEFVWTSSTGGVVNRPAPELRGSPDRTPVGAPYDAASPSNSWRTATYTQAQFSTIFAADARTNVGTILALDLSRRGVSGRLIAVTLIGTLGVKTVSGMLFQSIFNLYRPSGHPILRSTLVDLSPIPPGA
jgi:stage II sporulation protein D